MDGFGHGFRAGASFLFSVYRSAQVRSPNRPDESRKTRDARGELVEVRLAAAAGWSSCGHFSTHVGPHLCARRVPCM